MTFAEAKQILKTCGYHISRWGNVVPAGFDGHSKPSYIEPPKYKVNRPGILQRRERMDGWLLDKNEIKAAATRLNQGLSTPFK